MSKQTVQKTVESFQTVPSLNEEQQGRAGRIRTAALIYARTLEECTRDGDGPGIYRGQAVLMARSSMLHALESINVEPRPDKPR